jgi:hypothetical protein
MKRTKKNKFMKLRKTNKQKNKYLNTRKRNNKKNKRTRKAGSAFRSAFKPKNLHTAKNIVKKIGTEVGKGLMEETVKRQLTPTLDDKNLNIIKSNLSKSVNIERKMENIKNLRNSSKPLNNILKVPEPVKLVNPNLAKISNNLVKPSVNLSKIR